MFICLFVIDCLGDIVMYKLYGIEYGVVFIGLRKIV